MSNRSNAGWQGNESVSSVTGRFHSGTGCGIRSSRRRSRKKNGNKKNQHREGCRQGSAAIVERRAVVFRTFHLNAVGKDRLLFGQRSTSRCQLHRASRGRI